MTSDPSENEQRLRAVRAEWDAAAAGFDNEPDHGLRDPAVRRTWMDLLRRSLPPVPGAVLDIGCGTGSLSLILAELGWDVTGVDLSPEMIARAKAKAARAGISIPFQVMDAAHPQFSPGTLDAIVCRHLLWALPEPAQVLQRWTTLLAPTGRLLLIEGFWHTGSGLHSDEIIQALPTNFLNVSVETLSSQPALWGGPVSDERYLIIAQRG